MGFFDRFKTKASPAAPDDMAIAREAVDKRDWKHAASHVAGELAKDPTSEDALEVLDFVATAAGDGAVELLAPMPKEGESAWFGTMALRAELLARAGKYTDALSWLMQVVAAKPDAGYQAWIERWGEAEGFAEGTSPLPVLASVKEHADRRGDDPIGDVAREILRVVNAAHPADESLAFFLAATLRRGGRPDEAMAVAATLLDATPDSYLGKVALYNAMRDTGDVTGAIAVMREALALKPEEDSVRLDIGDSLLDLDSLPEATAAYGEVLARHPEHPWALPSSLYCRVKNGDAAARGPLDALALDGNTRARELVSAEAPYAYAVLPAAEATINSIAKMLEAYGDKPAPEAKPDGSPYAVKITLSSLESPSSLRSCEREFERRGWNVLVARHVEALQQPDPRVARREGIAHVLWEYDGGTPKERPAPPKSAVAERIAAIAASPYAMARWKPAARDAAAGLGPDALSDLLALLVHPPAAPAKILAWDWTLLVQTAASLTIAALPGGRAALLDVLDGPEDWTSCAAAIALAEIALDDATARDAIRDRFIAILKERPDRGYWCLEAPLVLSLLRFPGLDPELVEVLGTLKQRLAIP